MAVDDIPACTPESLALCAACGGACCQSSPCTYAPGDFVPMDVNIVMKALQKGRAVIDGSDGALLLRAPGKADKGQLFVTTIHKGPNPCALLGPRGCILPENERPLFGRLIMPSLQGNKIICDYPRNLAMQALQAWLDVQDVLQTALLELQS